MLRRLTDLFHLDTRQPGGLGHVLDHRLAVDAPVAIFVELQSMRSKAPNRAPGREELDDREFRCLASGGVHQAMAAMAFLIPGAIPILSRSTRVPLA